MGRGLCTLTLRSIRPLTTVESYEQPGYYDHFVGVGLSTEKEQTSRGEGEGVVQQHTKLSEEERKTYTYSYMYKHICKNNRKRKSNKW